jgi:hypothetical protein
MVVGFHCKVYSIEHIPIKGMKSNYHMTMPFPLYGNVLNRVHLAMKSNYHMTMPSPLYGNVLNRVHLAMKSGVGHVHMGFGFHCKVYSI